MPALWTPDASQRLLEVQVVTSKTQTHADRLDLSPSVPPAPISALCVQLLEKKKSKILLYFMQSFLTMRSIQFAVYYIKQPSKKQFLKFVS